MTMNHLKQFHPTRRTILLGGVLAAVGCQTKSNPMPTDSPVARKYIDAHSHVWTPDTQRFPLGSWMTADKMEPSSFTVEELLAIAEPCGVDRVVLIQHAPYFGADNSYLLDCVRRYPGRLCVVAIIDERRSDLADHLKSLKTQGVRGIRIGPSRYADRSPVADPPNWLKAATMRRLWKLASDENLILCPLVGAEFVPTLEPMIAEFHGVRVAIDHFGHCEGETLKSLLNLAKHKNVYVKASGFYKFGDKKAPYDDLAPMLKSVTDAFGPERMLWGSDCPYQTQSGNSYHDAVALIESGLDFLDASARRAILRETAERLFFK